METLEKNGAQASRERLFLFSNIASPGKGNSCAVGLFETKGFPEERGYPGSFASGMRRALAVAYRIAKLLTADEAACAHFYSKTEAAEVKTESVYQIGRAQGLILVEYEFNMEENRRHCRGKRIWLNMFVNLLGEQKDDPDARTGRRGQTPFTAWGEGGAPVVMSDKGQTSFRCSASPYQEPVLRAPEKDLSKEQIEHAYAHHGNAC